MPAMVFLKIAADVSFLFMLLGSIAVHFGSELWVLMVTMAVICAGQILSFWLSEKKKGTALRLLPYILPIGCAFIPGMTLSGWIICGIIYAYALFTGITRRYMADDEAQKVLFKITLGAIAAMLIIMLMVSAVDVSYTIVIFSGLISSVCSILLMRSLRHEPEIYSMPSYQTVNIGIACGVIGLSILLSTRTVLNGIFYVLKTIYSGIAYVVVNGLTLAIRGIAAAIKWIISLFPGGAEQAAETENNIELDMRSANDLFGDAAEYKGFPTWLKITGIVIAALIVIGIIILIFRKLAGHRTTETAKAASGTSYTDNGWEPERKKSSSQVMGVRKQYKKYIDFLRNEGTDITKDETSAEVNQNSPWKYQGSAAAELRQLYLKARYAEIADKEDAERAKDLVRAIKQAR